MDFLVTCMELSEKRTICRRIWKQREDILWEYDKFTTYLHFNLLMKKSFMIRSGVFTVAHLALGFFHPKLSPCLVAGETPAEGISKQ